MVRSRVNCTLGHVGIHTRPWSWLVFWKSIHDLCKEAKTPIIKLSQLQTLSFEKTLKIEGFLTIMLISKFYLHLCAT